MRILYVCSEYPPAPHGGIGTYTKLLAEELSKKGHEIMVVGYDSSKKKAIEEFVNGVRISRYPLSLKKKGGAGRVLSFVLKRRKLSRIVNNSCKLFNPDIVESYDWSGPLFAKPAKGHFVVRMHGAHAVHSDSMGGSKKQSRLLRLAEKRNLKLADSTVSVSNMILEKTVCAFNISPVRTAVIYNGVDVTRFSNNSTDKRDLKRLLFVGRVHHHKGLDYLFKALEVVFSQCTDAYLDIVGPDDSNYAKELKRSIPHSLRGRINFHGRVSNERLPAWYAASNLCLLPSRVEAFPIVPLEAMACGTPVIMSSLVASTEIIDDKEDGFIQDPGNTVGFAECIISALKNQDKTEIMRTRCRTKVLERFNLEKVVNDNIQFYKECLK